MTRAIASVALVVREYDEAIAFFTDVLRFTLVEDTPMGGGKRWVTIRPPGSAPSSTSLLIARAEGARQQAAIGNQTGGRVFLFLHTSDFWGDYAHMRAHGVRFVEEPRQEPFGQVVVFLDLYGNKWDLVRRAG